MGMGKVVDYSQFVLQLEKAIANGVATLDSSAKVPKNQIDLDAADVGAIAIETDPTVASFTKGLTSNDSILTALNAASGTISASVLPSYVDDFLTFANLAAFPVTGETGKIYLAENINLSYRWTGSSYIDISSAGTADQAVKLATPRTISTTGDATYSVSFDGSANVSGVITLANSGVSAGTYNNSATTVRPFTVDPKGKITGIGTAITIAPAWSNINAKPTTLSGYGITDALPLSGGTVTGVTTFSNTTASTSTTTGGVIFGGGIGASGDANIGGNINGVQLGIGGANSTLRVGFEAGIANPSGGSWVALGSGAGRFNTTGTSWVSIGTNSGRHNVSGSSWVSIGFNAGRFLEDGVSVMTVSSNSCYVGALTKGTNSSTNENVFGYNAAGRGSNTVQLGDNNIVRTYLMGVVDIANTTPSTSPTTGASVIGGGQGVLGDQHVAGFTSLGGTAGGHPAIKIKVLEGTTNASEGSATSVAHGVSASKIISVNAMVQYSTNNYILDGHTNSAGYLFHVSITPSVVIITNDATGSENIQSKPFVVTLIYKE